MLRGGQARPRALGIYQRLCEDFVESLSAARLGEICYNPDEVYVQWRCALCEYVRANCPLRRVPWHPTWEHMHRALAALTARFGASNADMVHAICTAAREHEARARARRPPRRAPGDRVDLVGLVQEMCNEIRVQPFRFAQLTPEQLLNFHPQWRPDPWFSCRGHGRVCEVCVLPRADCPCPGRARRRRRCRYLVWRGDPELHRERQQRYGARRAQRAERRRARRVLPHGFTAWNQVRRRLLLVELQWRVLLRYRLTLGFGRLATHLGRLWPAWQRAMWQRAAVQRKLRRRAAVQRHCGKEHLQGLPGRQLRLVRWLRRRAGEQKSRLQCADSGRLNSQGVKWCKRRGYRYDAEVMRQLVMKAEAMALPRGHLAIGTWNAHKRFNQLRHAVLDTFSGAHVLLLQEIEGYGSQRQPGQVAGWSIHQTGPQVGVAVRTALAHVVLGASAMPEGSDAFWVKLGFHHTVFVCSVYIQSGPSVEHWTAAMESLMAECAQRMHERVASVTLLGGDWNVDLREPQRARYRAALRQQASAHGLRVTEHRRRGEQRWTRRSTGRAQHHVPRALDFFIEVHPAQRARGVHIFGPVRAHEELWGPAMSDHLGLTITAHTLPAELDGRLRSERVLWRRLTETLPATMDVSHLIDGAQDPGEADVLLLEQTWAIPAVGRLAEILDTFHAADGETPTLAQFRDCFVQAGRQVLGETMACC